MEKQSTIQNQVKLPVAVAMGVVLQGIQIRFGRSLVTVTGVVLGIAFLMSILTGQLIRKSVAQEDATRAEVKRMLSFLTAETGPLIEKNLAILALGPLNDVEQRLLRAMAADQPRRIAWHAVGAEGAAPPAAAGEGALTLVPLEALGEEASAIVVVGAGAPAPASWSELTQGARQRVVAFTRQAGMDARQQAGAGVTQVVLERALRPEEVERQQQEARRDAFRSGWIIVLSLLVTVIGISNSMLMSVTERFREIGTMKCLGSTSAFIRQIFLIESSILGICGAISGSVIGALFSVVVYSVTYGLGLVFSSFDLLRWLAYLLLSVVAGMVLSIVAALYPAHFASRMVPATALRSNI